MSQEITHLPQGAMLHGGSYRIVRYISSGGFGCTYEAEHTMFRNRVAIKEFFVKDFCNRDDKNSHVTVGTLSKKGFVAKLREKFIEEAQVVHHMTHPGIVKVKDLFEENGTAYYVMDYIEGKSLAQLINERGALPEGKALKYIRQVADALAYVHSLDRLHLDVKPGNIMIDGNDNAILIDFGASKHYDSETGENTSTLMGVNTPGYAPAEQALVSFSQFNPAADIYSLGATLYKLVTGITPPDALSLMMKKATLPPMPPTVSAATQSAIRAAMQSDDANRPQSIPAFLSLLNTKDESTHLDTEKTIITTKPSIPAEETVIGNKEATEIDKESQNFHADNEETEKKADNEEIGIGRKAKFAAAFILCFVIIFLVGMLKDCGNSDSSGISITGSGSSYSASVDTVVVDSAVVDSVTMVAAGDEVGGLLATSGYENGYAYVDLGLSVKWATCNVGATSPEGYGDYFAWGETSPKSSYTEENSFTYGKEFGDIGDRRYDAARAYWGGSWRLPTYAEIGELREKCTWTWTTRNGVDGYQVKSKVNGNSIFLPAAGYRHGTSLNDAGSYGYYWGSTPYESGTQRAYNLYFGSSEFGRGWYSRYYGQSVRPVTE